MRHREEYYYLSQVNRHPKELRGQPVEVIGRSKDVSQQSKEEAKARLRI